MKKLISGVLALVMALSLVGCGGKEAEETYVWPQNEAGSLIDPPESKNGKLVWENNDGFGITINKVKQADYEAYLKKCTEKGFDVDYTKTDHSYYASNGNGYKLSLIYFNDDKELKIYLEKEPEKEEPDTSSSSGSPSSEASSSSIVPASGIRPEVKEAIDSYETFMDEYAAFMKKYNNSNDTMSMLTEYADYMSKYADALSKFNALNTDLNNDEAAYYAEVSMRVAQKLLDAAG